MRILFAGTPAAAVPSLAALLASRHDVVGVLTRPDAPQGRGRSLVPSAVRVHAEQAGLPVLTDRPRGAAFLRQVHSLQVECVAVVAYGEILRPEVLASVPYGWINLHFSLLPAWRGAAPVQRAIIAGDELVGASTFVIEEGLDTGPVLGMVTQAIGPRDTAGDVLDTLAAAGAGLLVATMDAIGDGTASPVPQGSDGVSHAAKLTVAEGRVDWRKPALHLDRLVRGFTPNPGAWTTTPTGDRLGLGPLLACPGSARQVSENMDSESLRPGEILVGKREVLVGTGSWPVLLTTVTPRGKKPMPAADWARGARLSPGSVLGGTDDEGRR